MDDTKCCAAELSVAQLALVTVSHKVIQYVVGGVGSVDFIMNGVQCSTVLLTHHVPFSFFAMIVANISGL